MTRRRNQSFKINLRMLGGDEIDGARLDTYTDDMVIETTGGLCVEKPFLILCVVRLLY